MKMPSSVFSDIVPITGSLLCENLDKSSFASHFSPQIINLRLPLIIHYLRFSLLLDEIMK